MSVETMQDLVTSEVKDLYSAKKQATTMYPRLIEGTSSQELKLTGLSSTVNEQALADGEEFDEEEEDEEEAESTSSRRYVARVDSVAMGPFSGASASRSAECARATLLPWTTVSKRPSWSAG